MRSAVLELDRATVPERLPAQDARLLAVSVIECGTGEVREPAGEALAEAHRCSPRLPWTRS